MSELEFTVGGNSMTADIFRATAQRAAPRPKREAEAKHMGFIVTGYPPGYVVDCERLARQNFARWQNSSAEEQRKWIKSGAELPRDWDELAWLRKNAPKRCAKPFATPQAADTLADMVRKAGWTHVEANALVRGGK